MHAILEDLAQRISHGDRTFETLEAQTKVNRSTLCRLAQRKIPLMSIDVAAKIAKAFGFELRLVRCRK